MKNDRANDFVCAIVLNFFGKKYSKYLPEYFLLPQQQGYSQILIQRLIHQNFHSIKILKILKIRPLQKQTLHQENQ